MADVNLELLKCFTAGMASANWLNQVRDDLHTTKSRYRTFQAEAGVIGGKFPQVRAQLEILQDDLRIGIDEAAKSLKENACLPWLDKDRLDTLAAQFRGAVMDKKFDEAEQRLKDIEFQVELGRTAPIGFSSSMPAKEKLRLLGEKGVKLGSALAGEDEPEEE